MRVVIDTNVIVSALISPDGKPAQILDMAVNGKLAACWSSLVFAEYQLVLSRPKLGIPEIDMELALAGLVKHGLQVPVEPWVGKLPDPDDVIFLAAAKTAAAEFLITGNLKDFPPDSRGGVEVVSPDEFLRLKFDIV